MMSFKAVVERYIKEFETDRKIVATIAGGGYSFVDLLKVPGASRKVEEISCPYGDDSLASMCVDTHAKSVCKEVAIDLAINTKAYYELVTDCKNVYIGITAALRTDRKRRGAEEAFITITTEDETYNYHLTFEGYPSFGDYSNHEGIRLCQDFDVAQAALALIMNPNIEDNECLPDLHAIVEKI